MQWDSSTRLAMVPDFSDAFGHFAMSSKVSHFPDPSDVPVLRQIVSRCLGAVNALHHLLVTELQVHFYCYEEVLRK